MKALIITGKFATHDEVFYPLHRLKEAGYEVGIAVRGAQLVLSDLGGKIQPTMDIPVWYDEYTPDILILPGGAKAMEYQRQDKEIISYISTFHKIGKTIGVICHGTQLMISAGVVKGRRISGYYSIKDDIINAGGTYEDCEQSHFVTDGNIVSSSHYKHLGPWMAEILRVARAD